MANNSKEAVRSHERQKKMEKAVKVLEEKNKKALKEAHEAANGCWSTVLGVATLVGGVLLFFS